MKKIINFIKYHNAFTIGLGLVLLLTAGVFASDDVRDAVVGEKIVTENGIDNSQLLAADLDNFDFNLEITGVVEDDENYYVDYAYQMLAIKDYVWQTIKEEERMNISKKMLGADDLGLYVQEELSELADYKISYLKEAQASERKRGLASLVVSVDYTGLIGLVLDMRDKILPGYEPVITEEICDGIDNNKNEQIDEGFNIGAICVAGNGACRQEGTYICSSDGKSVCSAVAGTPSQEVCDGTDNNCDGKIDEGSVCFVPEPFVEQPPAEQPPIEQPVIEPPVFMPLPPATSTEPATTTQPAVIDQSTTTEAIVTPETASTTEPVASSTEEMATTTEPVSQVLTEPATTTEPVATSTSETATTTEETATTTPE